MILQAIISAALVVAGMVTAYNLGKSETEYRWHKKIMGELDKEMKEGLAGCLQQNSDNLSIEEHFEQAQRLAMNKGALMFTSRLLDIKLPELPPLKFTKPSSSEEKNQSEVGFTNKKD